MAVSRRQGFREANEEKHSVCVTTTESGENQKALYECTVRGPGREPGFPLASGRGEDRPCPRKCASSYFCWGVAVFAGLNSCTGDTRPAPTVLALLPSGAPLPPGAPLERAGGLAAFLGVLLGWGG